MANMLDKKAFNEQVRLLFQAYLDECSTETDGFIEGLDITHQQAADFVNDVMLHYQEGEPLTEGQKVEPQTPISDDD